MADVDEIPAVVAARAPTKRYEARRNAIIASAVAVVNRRGVRGMTLGDVTAQLNLVPTGVIYYFKNKEELAAAAFLKGIERYEALLADSLADGAQADRLASFVRGYFAFRQRVALGQADQIALFNDIRALNCQRVNDAYVEMFRRARTLLPGHDGLPKIDRNARTHLLLSELSWSLAFLDDWETADYPRLAERMIDLLLEGLANPALGWPETPPIRLIRPDDPSARSSSELFLRAATQLINDEGYHGASVERISASLNVSKGAFYHHNETKDELVVACFQRTFDMMWRAIRAAEALGGSGLETLVSMASALVQHQLHGEAPLLRTTALTTVPESIRLGMIAKLNRISLRCSSIVSDGIADGSIRPVDAAIAAQMVTAAVNAAAELHFWAPGVTDETAAEHWLKPLFLGLNAVPALVAGP